MVWSGEVKRGLRSALGQLLSCSFTEHDTRHCFELGSFWVPKHWIRNVSFTMKVLQKCL
jgi:hypothetical protein